MNRDVFFVLDRMTKGDYDFILSLTEKEMKELSPFVILSFIMGAKTEKEARTIMNDLFVNPFIFTLSKHTRLVLLCMVAANEGLPKTGYTFFKQNKTTNNKHIRYIMNHLACSEDAAREYFTLLEEPAILEIEMEIEEKEK